MLVTLVGSPSTAQLAQIAASFRIMDEPGAPQPPIAGRGR
jgi:hypothetical protein